ncbi:MAG: phenylalanine--tRNA ligase subunit alpha [Firmicutes bacterium]|jgi:phenylalanyl-tRNA synthetase alpha chain|nr:phenylalanine--tRNA ligase subunit alpha [Bacillota bacterium]
MQASIDRLQMKLKEEIAGAGDLNELDNIRVRYLGKKGEITLLIRNMSRLSPEERPLFGRRLNELKAAAETMLEERKKELYSELSEKRWEKERVDITLPGRPFNLGRKHPVTMVLQEIEEIFTSMGFKIAEGPEVELDYYNFEALNMPKDHPARDMQDSFYINPGILLRTHTSPVEVRTMQAQAPELPVRIISPGKVYRRDDDITHSPMFHQVEGLVVDKGISLADLKGTLLMFAREMFGKDREIRLRPSFFPFTEPSAEVDISCIACNGKGCRICGETGWLEILGSGMSHPRVLEVSGYNPEEVSGYAFGMGVERIAMLKYGIDDIRLFYTNDLRMLSRY